MRARGLIAAAKAATSHASLVYIEHFAGELYLDQPDEVESYDTTLRDLLGVTDGAGSRDLIAARMRELRE